jgi:hypothetical protein
MSSQRRGKEGDRQETRETHGCRDLVWRDDALGV